MASKAGRGATNGSGDRKCQSWIESFIHFTEASRTPKVFREWTAITTIGAALEQKVWLTTRSNIYPNLYTFLVGHPGVGKTLTIVTARKFLEKLSNLRIAPTSMTMASLVDALDEAKRSYTDWQTMVMFNSLALLNDDLSVLMAKFDRELIAGLTQFYDVHTYSQTRRGMKINIRIDRPQLTFLAGTTPSDLHECLPVSAWGQGFTSRIILVYSGEKRTQVDQFNLKEPALPNDMVHDLEMIHTLIGGLEPTDGFQKAVADWCAGDEGPKPNHPKLEHYNSRRRVQLYKLSIISAVDRGNALVLLDADFHRALAWLEAAEMNMINALEEGITSVDSQAMDEIVAFVRRQARPVHKSIVIRYANGRVPSHSVLKVLDLLIHAEQLHWNEETKSFTTNKG